MEECKQDKARAARREYARKRRLEHPDECREYDRKWREEHREERRAYEREYYHKNKERARENQARYWTRRVLREGRIELKGVQNNG